MAKERGDYDLFWLWGLAIYRYRWIVVMLCAALFLGLGFYARKVPDQLRDNGFAPRGSESDTGFTLLQDNLGFASSTITVVYTSDRYNLRSPEQTERIVASVAPLTKLPYVRIVKMNENARLNGDSDVQSVHIELDQPMAEALNVYPEVRSRIREPAGMKVYVDGPAATMYDIQNATKKDLAKSEMLGLPIALLVLIFIFGTVTAAVLPLIVGVMSVAVTLGVTYFIAEQYSLSNFMPNMVTMVGLAIGIDYALFVVSRFREELARGVPVGTAVAVTCRMAGKSIFYSGFAVLIGMLGMLFIDLPVMRALCLGGVLVVLSSVSLSNTLLLALLGILGHRINRLAVFPALQRRRSESTLWERIAFSVMKRPAIFAVLISGLLILLMVPIGGMKLGVPTAEVLPPSYESRQGSDLLKQTYDIRHANPIQIVVRTSGPFWEESAIRDMQAFTRLVRQESGVRQLTSYTTVLADRPPAQAAILLRDGDVRSDIERRRLASGDTALVSVVPDSDPESAETADLILRLRSLDTGGMKTYVTGTSANRVDIMERIDRGIPAMIAFVMGITYLVLFAAFRSILLPLKAVAMNILSLGASMGIVVIIFQKGMLADFLRITSIGYVSIVLPVTIFCVVFGISMDYEVFLLSRIKEEYERTGDNDHSTAVGLTQTGGLITSAALILIVVVGSFVFTDIEVTKALGVGLFSAIFIDATFIRVIVVPALMKLLGRANWWAPVWSR